MTPPVPFTAAGVLRGARRAQALAASVLVYGMAFGLVAAQAGLTVGDAGAMSVAVYSGSAQLAALGVIADAPSLEAVSLGAIAATILVMNARYLLFGAALRPWLGAVSPTKAYASLFFLGDGNWLLAMQARAAGERDGGFVLGSGLVMFAGWIAGTLLGATAGAAAPDPRMLGLDFLLVAFAAAMMVGMARGRADLLPAGAGAAAAIVVGAVASFGWAVVAAGLAGAAAAAIRATRQARPA